MLRDNFYFNFCFRNISGFYFYLFLQWQRGNSLSRLEWLWKHAQGHKYSYSFVPNSITPYSDFVIWFCIHDFMTKLHHYEPEMLKKWIGKPLRAVVQKCFVQAHVHSLGHCLLCSLPSQGLELRVEIVAVLNTVNFRNIISGQLSQFFQGFCVNICSAWRPLVCGSSTFPVRGKYGYMVREWGIHKFFKPV